MESVARRAENRCRPRPVQRYQDSHDNPFAEPAPLASNIRNGYGLFGGATDTKLVIPIQ